MLNTARSKTTKNGFARWFNRSKRKITTHKLQRVLYVIDLKKRYSNEDKEKNTIIKKIHSMEIESVFIEITTAGE